MAECFIVVCLDGKRGVIRGSVKKRRFGKIEENYIGESVLAKGEKHSVCRGALLLFECRKPPIIWTWGGDRQRISSSEVSCEPAIGCAIIRDGTAASQVGEGVREGQLGQKGNGFGQ